jgi:hypothetical protein
MNPTKIVIVVGGGCLREVLCSDPDASYKLIDCDNLKEQGLSDDEIEDAINKAGAHTFQIL